VKGKGEVQGKGEGEGQAYYDHYYIGLGATWQG
jgi:hypothetical protein